MNITSKLPTPKICFGIFLVLVLPYILWFSVLRTSVRPRAEKPFNFYIEDSISQAPLRTILLWNKFFLDSRWTLSWDTVGPSFFKFNHCPKDNCVITNKPHYLPSIDKFDAIFFHMASMSDIQYQIPSKRSPSQLYVFSMLESPLFPFLDMMQIKEVFNLTMTYRLDSDMLWTYGAIMDIETGRIVAPTVKPRWRQPPEVYSNAKLEAIVLGKKKFAVWFSSHCITLSKREQLVATLKMYVSVDVYGSCGPLVCQRNADECDAIVNRDYKFYFSFENSLCVDYVTEKLKKAMVLLVIPVVFGGADYSRFAPPHSYIDANNFTSVKELADYMTYLSDNPKEYIRYFWWRKYYRPVFASTLCDICSQVNAYFKGSKLQMYTDIRTWWKNNTCYPRPRITFRTQRLV